MTKKDKPIAFDFSIFYNLSNNRLVICARTKKGEV